MTRKPGDRPASKTQSVLLAGGASRRSPWLRLHAACLRHPFPCALSRLRRACAIRQSAAPIPDFVVTATRSPLAITQAGSAISVITSEEIEKESIKTPAEVLRRVPGVTLVETGGPGGTTTVRIRGAEAGQTLVLIDGISVNDPLVGFR